MFRYSLVLWFACLAGACCLQAGCTSGPRRAGPVDEALAREALRMTLESWKSGATLASLKELSPGITAQDADWMTGCKLVNYQVLGEGRNDDANLRCPVELTLRDPAGREVKKRVTYIIGTDPVITVFREISL